MEIPLEPIDTVHISTVIDNVVDVLMADQGPAKRPYLGDPRYPKLAARTLQGGQGPDAPRAEHGFSALVEIHKGARSHRVLFDTGVTPDGLIENMRRLDITLKDIETIVLSHGHLDHTTGMDGLIRTLGKSGLPVYIHPEFWSKRRVVFPGRDPLELPSTSKSALQEAGFEIIEEVQPSFLLDGSLLVTGEVDRTSDFETGFPIHQAFRSGQWEPDPLILDDQALVMNVKDKGLVVLSGCGHAGIVNILRYARKLVGIDQIYAVIGGFHLTGGFFEKIIPQTCQALKEISPTYLVPAHCTGWKAVNALASAFPEQFIPNSVGTRFEL